MKPEDIIAPIILLSTLIICIICSFIIPRKMFVKRINGQIKKYISSHGKIRKIIVKTSTWSEWDYTTYVGEKKFGKTNDDEFIEILLTGFSECIVKTSQNEEQDEVYITHIDKIEIQFDDNYEIDID